MLLMLCPFLLTGLISGCSAALEPPALKQAGGKRAVYLIDHGRHPSLVLRNARGGGVRYAYGDFAWFAESDTSWRAGARALLIPTPGALGRQELKPWHSRADLRRRIPEGVEHVYGFSVTARAARDLARRLDGIHDQPPHREVDNRRFGLTFAPHPERYWMLNNSNQITARWLEELGVRVDGPALLSRWQIGP